MRDETQTRNEGDKTMLAEKMTWEDIQKAVTEGRAFIDSGYGKHYISEYTRAGLVTFEESKFRSTTVYGTGRIEISPIF